ncbi:MAG: UDP-glucose 4-epimerase GalE [Bacteroidota bacterium]|nr:UDP-glucose 4-epimerase GalE [Bacteroidota bacterium]
MKKIVVTGGCGYIGSHTMVDLIQQGYQVVSVDSLINSDEDVLDGIYRITGAHIKNHILDLTQEENVHILKELEPDIDGIIHFAALKAVGESVQKPLLYYHNNVKSLLNILQLISDQKIPSFIFSSSCTVYGETTKLPVSETDPFLPTGSPYGRSKQMGELMMQDYYLHANIKSISLRYFNPAGAHESALIGESSINPALNLVPVITETAIRKRNSFTVFGTDYPTRDGSCIRDYIHVMDLARAHTLALQYLEKNSSALGFEAFNLGIGEGVSVLEAIRAFEEENQLKLNYKMGERRAGDLPAMYANYEKAKKYLSWTPQQNIRDIMRTAWAWEKVRSQPLSNY